MGSRGGELCKARSIPGVELEEGGAETRGGKSVESRACEGLLCHRQVFGQDSFRVW